VSLRLAEWKMTKIQIGEREYWDKVYACWLGKNIGGTLGAPYEGKKYVNCLEYYGVLPEKAAPNDDLDLQLIWLKMLEDRGVDPALPDFAEYWKRHASAYPWNEYGFLRRNLERGLMPPISGCFENYYLDEMGSPIRSEIWACIAPGDPQIAASMAWKDSVIDHAGGEGMYGEMFWAALESAAFVIDDPKTLIQIGLAMIPLSSMISRAVREALWCHENGVSWTEAREHIVTYYGHYQPCHAPQNHGFTILGWLYGKDYGDKLCKAVNCGYDTDCTGATLGSLLGILGGIAGIPQEWRSPIGDEIVLHKFTSGLDAPKNIGELTNRVFAIARRFLAEKSDVATFGRETVVPDNLLSLLFRNEKALMVLQQDTQAAVAVDGGLEITLHYWGEPVIRPGVDKTLGVSLTIHGAPIETEVALEAPAGWEVKNAGDFLGQKCFILRAAEVPDRNTLGVHVTLSHKEGHADFSILGPGEAKGYPSGKNVPTCPRCHAWIGACICGTT